jgi:hypothetical protein
MDLSQVVSIKTKIRNTLQEITEQVERQSLSYYVIVSHVSTLSTLNIQFISIIHSTLDSLISFLLVLLPIVMYCDVYFSLHRRSGL